MVNSDLHSQPLNWNLALSQRPDCTLILLDVAGVIYGWSGGAEQLFKYTEAEVTGKNFSFLLAQTEKSFEIIAQLDQARTTTTSTRFAASCRRQDGSVAETELNILPVYNHQQDIIGFSLSVVEIKASPIVDKPDPAIKTQTPDLTENVLNYAIFMLDTEGKIITWNKGANKLTRYPAEDIIGQHFSKLYLPDDINSGLPLFDLNKTLADGHSESAGWRIAKDGYIFWSENTLSPVYNHQQELLGFTAILRDFTESRLLEKSLRNSEERYRLLVEGVEDYSIIMLDPNGYIRTWNKGAEKIKGYKPEEIIGRHFSIFFTQEALEADIPNLELIKAREQGHSSYEGWRKRRDGSLFWGDIVLNALKNEKNQLIGFCKIARDLTSRRIQQQELEKTNKQLTLVNRDLDNFIYVASHDLKAPILNIEGLMTLLQVEKNMDTAEAKDIMQMIMQCINSFKTTIEDLTDISAIQKKFSLETLEKIDLSEILEQVKVNLKSELESTNTIIRCDFSRVPYLYFSRKNLRSILYNLLSNAIKYRSPDRAPDIYLKTEIKAGGYVLFTIQDNGLGIEEKHQEKAFSIFKRVHNHVEGRGLGLYLVKKMMDNSEGIIDMYSEKNEGTTFRLYFKQPED